MKGKEYSVTKSRDLFNRAENLLPGGVNGNIKFRNPFPIFLSRASGSHIWDVDSNEYIDYNLSYGALILGHSHPVIVRALKDAIDNYGTLLFGNPNVSEIEFAELLLNIYYKDGRIRFTNSGMEATLLAVRLGVAYTGKRKVGKFDGHYHGANPLLLSNYRPTKGRDVKGKIVKEADSIEIQRDLLDNVVILPFNDIEGTKEILEREDVGTIILEPFEDGYIPANIDFMNFLRQYTKERGIVLIFDEVKTGFRVRIGGAVEYYSLKPDLICLGKIIGGGTPIGAVLGKTEIMELLDPRRENERRVFHSGTFNGNPLSMSLGIATVNELISGNNFLKIQRLSDELRKEISGVLSDLGISHRMYGEGGIVNYTLSDDVIKTYRDISKKNMENRKKIDSLLTGMGVYLIPGSRFSMSTAHSESDISETVASIKVAVKRLLDRNEL